MIYRSARGRHRRRLLNGIWTVIGLAVATLLGGYVFLVASIVTAPDARPVTFVMPAVATAVHAPTQCSPEHDPTRGVC